jgi:hypothetical protein
LGDASGNTNAGFLTTEEVFAGDVTVRVRSTADSAVFAFLHLDLDAATGYGAFVCDTCVDGSRHLVGLYRADGWGVTPLVLTRPAGFDPGEGDVRLEISTQGEFVECRVWPEAADRPDAAVFRIRDGRYRSGAAAFAVDPRQDGSPAPAFLRWAEITISRPDPVAFGRGDCNDDGGVDLSDAVCILNWLFLDGLARGCIAVMNTNGATGVDISDATYLLNHLFLEGPAPAAPYPDCGFGTLPSDEGTCESPPRRCQP